MSEVSPLRIANPVASNVRAELARRGIKVSHLPRYIGQNVAYWGRRDRGTTPYDANDLIALSELLDVSPGVFFAGLDVPGNARSGRIDGGSDDPATVRRQGLEPRTRYISASASESGLDTIAPAHADDQDGELDQAPAVVYVLPARRPGLPGATKAIR